MKHLRFELYERAVTNPLMMAGFLASVCEAGGGRAQVLREDFSGTGALARGWVELGQRAGAPGRVQQARVPEAIAVDRDARVVALARAAGKGLAGFRAVRADARRCAVRADVIAATNFAVGYLHTRGELVGYLRHARACLRGGGAFVCDMYGGSGAWRPGVTRKKVRSLGRASRGREGWGAHWGAFWYEWEQETCDETTGLVRCHIHFEVPARRGPGLKTKSLRLERAFTYAWRLWGIAELRDAMLEAGFVETRVYDRLGAGVDQEGRLYLEEARGELAEGLGEEWVVYVAGFAGKRRG